MSRSRITAPWTAAAALAALFGIGGPAAAQVPSVTAVFPPGGQIGATATVSVTGGNLQGATKVLLSGEGVEAQLKDTSNAAALPVELKIAPNALPGLREVRVVTPRGTSNAGRIWIGGYPEINEADNNNTLATAQKLEKIPVTVNGQVNGGEDVDAYTFQANAGDTYVFDLVGFRMWSPLDAFLSLVDSRGKSLASRSEAFDRDPRLIYQFKNAGTYSIQVRDSMYRGGANFVYKLTVGPVPAITSYLPLGGKRGETVNVALEGVNLGDMKSWPVQIPADRDSLVVAPSMPSGMAVSPISLYASDLPEAVEAEPNDTPAQATSVAAVPVVLNGRMNKEGDVDLFRIKPAAAGTLSFEIFGRRIGSRMDAYLRVLAADGKAVAGENDDAEGKDSRVSLAVAAGTEYLVEVKTLDKRSGEDFYYRLRIDAPTGQDFRLTMTPDTANVGQQGSAALTVTATRLNGFGGPISVRVEGLPEGVTASPAVIPAGAANTQFTLTAAAGVAPGTMGQIRVIGTGTIGEKPVERTAVPIETYQPPLTQPEQARQRPTLLPTATVMPQQAYALTLDQKEVTVKRGEKATVKVTAVRLMGQTAAINLTAAGQPANVTPALQNIDANATEATLTFAVAANAPIVKQNIIISGNMSNNVQVAPAFTINIVE